MVKPSPCSPKQLVHRGEKRVELRTGERIGQDAELVATEPIGARPPRHGGAQRRGEADEQGVAGGVAEAVVVFLEAVEVEDRQRRGTALVDEPRDVAHEPAAVAQAGQRIGHAEVLELALGLAHALADALVEPPGGHPGGAGQRDEQGVQPGPGPRIAPRRRRVEHRPRIDVPMMPWWMSTNATATRKGNPVLVQRQDHDHHEEAEVHLDEAARDVHEGGGPGEQAHRRRHRAPLARHVAPAGEADERDHREELRDVADSAPLMLDGGVDGDDADHHDQEQADQPMAAAPVRLGQGPAVGQEAAHPRQRRARAAAGRFAPDGPQIAHVSGLAFKTNSGAWPVSRWCSGQTKSSAAGGLAPATNCTQTSAHAGPGTPAWPGRRPRSRRSVDGGEGSSAVYRPPIPRA